MLSSSQLSSNVRVFPLPWSLIAPDSLVIPLHVQHLRLTTPQLPEVKQLNPLGSGSLYVSMHEQQVRNTPDQAITAYPVPASQLSLITAMLANAKVPTNNERNVNQPV